MVDVQPLRVYMHTMPDELNLTKMENCVCFNLRWVSRAMTQFYDRQLRRYGLLPTQTPILGALAAKSQASMSELSNWLGMDRTTLLRNLRPLERDGLVKASGKGRGGKVTLGLTVKGRATLSKAMEGWKHAQEQVVKTLGAARWSAILSDLERATQGLEQ